MIAKKYNELSVQVKATLWFLICGFLQKGITMLTTPIFTRLLTTDEYGQFNVFISWMGIISIFVSLNLAAGVFTQGLVKFDEEKAVYASSMQGLTTTLLILWICVYFVGYRYWNTIFNLSTSQMVVMLVMIWTSAIFSLWASYQRVLYKYKCLVITTVIVSVAKPLVGIILVRNCLDRVNARILGLLVVEVIGYSWMYVAQMKTGKKFFVGKFWKHALLFNLPLVPHYLSQVVLNNADRIMIKEMVGDGEAGIYSLAYALASIMLLFNNAFMQAISPWIYQKIKNKEITLIAPVAYGSLGVVGITNLLLIIFAPELVRLFAPQPYYEAIWIIPPVALSGFLLFSYDLFAKFAFYYERTKLVMLTSVLGAILNVVLNALLIRKFGYLAAGYTTLVCYMVYAIGHYCLMNMICNKFCDGVKPYSTRVLVFITFSILFVGFLINVMYEMTWGRYVVFVFFIILLFINRKKIILFVKYLLDINRKA